MLRVTHPGCTLVAQAAVDRSVYNTARLQCHHQWQSPAFSLLGWVFHHLSCYQHLSLHPLCRHSRHMQDVNWNSFIQYTSTILSSAEAGSSWYTAIFFFPILLFSFLVKPAEITVSAPYALPAQFLLNYLTPVV